MDLRLDRNENKELVVIRSSSCVIKICETSSVFHSCRSDESTSVSQQTRVSRHIESPKTIPRKTRQTIPKCRECSKEDAAAERSRNARVRPQLPVMNLIAPAVKDSHSSEMSVYDMFGILIHVLNELKSDCESLFGKQPDGRDENPVKLLMKECFTDIMVRYATDPLNTKNSYNRCQKIISKSIKGLTMECVDIVERAICEQAKKHQEDRETAKSLLTKVMQLIQAELNKSNRVLKIVNTELHQPSFRYIFGLLKHFIETAASGFKIFCRSREAKVKCSGESCENSELSEQKFDEYSSRLDRMLEKVSSAESSTTSPVVIDCFHCTTKCKDQDILLQTVTRFTEEIKHELMNHARILQERTHYSEYENSRGPNSKEVSIYSGDVSKTNRKNLQADASDLSRERKLVPNSIGQRHERTQDPVSRNDGKKSNSPERSISPPSAYHTETSKHKPSGQHLKRCPLTNEITLHSKREPETSRSPSPTYSTKHQPPECKNAHCPQKNNKAVEDDSSSFSISTKASINKCRYCNKSAKESCNFDGLRIGPTSIPHTLKTLGENLINSTFSTRIQEGDGRYKTIENSQKLFVENKKSIISEPKSRKIVPKEEQGLVKKSKPAKDKGKETGSHQNNENVDETIVQNDKSNDASGKRKSKDVRRKSKIEEGNTALKRQTIESVTTTENPKVTKKVNLDPLPRVNEPPQSKPADPKDQHTNSGPTKDDAQSKINHPPSETELKEVSGNQDPRRADETLRGASKAEPAKTKDPAHCCRTNCNCRNRRGENESQERISHSVKPDRKDSTNQTEHEPNSSDRHNNCCQGCNCTQNAMPIFMNGCACMPVNPQEGGAAMRPIYQFFANPVPIPCNCKDSPQTKEQKEAQTSKPSTPKSGKRVSLETSTQTSRDRLNKAPSDVSSPPPSSSAPTKSTPSSSAPSSYASSSGPFGYTKSSSEPTGSKSTTGPTSSSLGKSESQLSCTCSMDQETPESCMETQISKAKVKDACTSDTNCSCPEKIEEVFQEFDDKYSQVVKEIKFLIREGYIPLNKEETREFSVTAARTSPEGTSSKTAACRCTAESCKRCRGHPAAAFVRSPQSKLPYSKKTPTHYEDSGEDGFRPSSYKLPKKEIYYSDEYLEHPPPPPFASKDTFIYNELQKDINDLKELVKKTRFGNCPCCTCCKCEPGHEGKPCPTTFDESGTGQSKPPQGTKSGADPLPKNGDKEPGNAPQPIKALGKGPGKEPQDGNEKNPEGKNLQDGKGKTPEGKNPQDGKGKNPEGKNPGEKKKRNSVKEDNQLEQKSENPPIDGPKQKENNSLERGGTWNGLKSSLGARPRHSVTAEIGDPEQTNEPQGGFPKGGLPTKDEEGGPTQGGNGFSDSEQVSRAGGNNNENRRNRSLSPNKQDVNQAGAKTISETGNGSPRTSVTNPSPPDQPELDAEPTLGTGPNDGKGQGFGALGPVAAAVAEAVASAVVNSSILKDSGKEKAETKASPKRVEIDERLVVPSTSTAQEFPVSRKMEEKTNRKPGRTPEKAVQKTASNVSFGSAKSATTSQNLALSPEKEALYQSREKLRDFSNYRLGPVEDDDRPHVPDDAGNEALWFFSKIFGGGDKTQKTLKEDESTTKAKPSKKTPAEPPKEKDDRSWLQRIVGPKDERPSDTKKDDGKNSKKDGNSYTSDDSCDGSSSDSATEICRNLIGMDKMPCRFYSSESAPGCQGVDTYVVVLESETPDLVTRDKTYIFSDNTTSRDETSNFHDGQSNRHRKLAESGLVETENVPKSTSPLWKKRISTQELIGGLIDPAPSALPADLLERELSKKLVRKPKKLVSPLNVSSHYARVRCEMPKNRRRRSGGDLRAYSSESVRRNPTKPPETRDKEVQVTKWNAMTQTSGPRKFNRTDISKETEDKLAKYLGLERTVEDISNSLTVSSASERKTVKRKSPSKKDKPLERDPEKS